jgi:hypothetical protein
MGEVSPKLIKSKTLKKSTKGSPLQPSSDSYKPAQIQAEQENKVQSILKKHLADKKGKELFETKKTVSVDHGETIIEPVVEF